MSTPTTPSGHLEAPQSATLSESPPRTAPQVPARNIPPSTQLVADYVAARMAPRPALSAPASTPARPSDPNQAGTNPSAAQRHSLTPRRPTTRDEIKVSISNAFRRGQPATAPATAPQPTSDPLGPRVMTRDAELERRRQWYEANFPGMKKR